jgi:hypothetical protein
MGRKEICRGAELFESRADFRFGFRLERGGRDRCGNVDDAAWDKLIDLPPASYTTLQTWATWRGRWTVSPLGSRSDLAIS